MKTTLVRAAVVTLALIGFGASNISAKVAAASHKTAPSMTPSPVCLPDYSDCGVK